jgi:hypothetical protein
MFLVCLELFPLVSKVCAIAIFAGVIRGICIFFNVGVLAFAKQSRALHARDRGWGLR